MWANLNLNDTRNVTALQWITLLLTLCVYCMTRSCTNVSVDDDITTGSKCLHQTFLHLITLTYCMLNQVQLNTNSIMLIMLGVGPSIQCRPHILTLLCNCNNSTNKPRHLKLYDICYVWLNPCSTVIKHGNVT